MEHAIIKLRRHPIVFVLESSVFILLLFIPAVVKWFFTSLGVDVPVFEQEEVMIGLILLSCVYYLYILLFLLYSFLIFFLDRWIVTDEHIMDIQQKTLFSRVISKQEVGRIQDVTAEVKGFFPSLFNYGDVHIQTAGASERITFSQVPRPYEVSSTLMRLAKEITQPKL